MAHNRVFCLCGAPGRPGTDEQVPAVRQAASLLALTAARRPHGLPQSELLGQHLQGNHAPWECLGALTHTKPPHV